MDSKTKGQVASSAEGAGLRERLLVRLEELQREFNEGERQLRQVEAQQVRIRQTMLRIEGAIHLVRELLETEGRNGESSSQSPGEDVEQVLRARVHSDTDESRLRPEDNAQEV